MSDVVQPDPSEVGQASAFWKLCRLLGNRATVDAEDPGFDESSVEQILLAQDEEEMWESDDRGPLGGRDLAGIAQIVQGVEVKFSRDNVDIRSPFKDPETGRRFYLLITSIYMGGGGKTFGVEKGEKFVWNTSAPRIVAKLTWMELNGVLDQREVVIDATNIGGGQQVLKLRKIRDL